MPATWTSERDVYGPPLARRRHARDEVRATCWPATLWHDLLRDWRRWSKAERIAAFCLLTTLLSSLPALFIATALRATD